MSSRTKSLEDIRACIEDAIENDGQLSHNIVSGNLRTAAQKFGRKVANDLVDEFGLTEKFGIKKIEG